MWKSNSATEIGASVMPQDYRIQPYDVLNGRGKIAFNNVGNRRFRVTLALALTKYLTAPNRQEKTKLIISVIELVRRNGGHFLTRSKGRWVEIGNRAAREKVGHAFRDMVGAYRKKNDAIKARSGTSTSHFAHYPTNRLEENAIDGMIRDMLMGHSVYEDDFLS